MANGCHETAERFGKCRPPEFTVDRLVKHQGRSRFADADIQRGSLPAALEIRVARVTRITREANRLHTGITRAAALAPDDPAPRGTVIFIRASSFLCDIFALLLIYSKV